MAMSIETIKKILGIKGKVDLTPLEMAKDLRITFFPNKNNVGGEVKEFGKKLENTFKNLGVTVIPYENALESPSLSKMAKRWFLFFRLRSLIMTSLKSKDEIKKFKSTYSKKFIKFVFGKKIKKRIVVILLGEGKEGNLPMDFTTSFKENPIITIVERNKEVGAVSSFEKHMEEALGLFAWNMTNLAVCVDKDSWTIYSFNLSNPTLAIGNNFDEDVLNSLVPKISAPVVPPSISDFKIIENDFEPSDSKYAPYIEDLIKSGEMFEKTKLYPAGRLIDSLKFKNLFYRWIGAIHLDERNGMSYGFLARQLPVKLEKALPLSDVEDENLRGLLSKNEYVFYKDNSYVKINIKDSDLIIKIPDVWVLTSRSGANKTELNADKDVIRLGLKNGQMFLGLAKGVRLSGDYKPSFDTRIILSHAVANAILGSIIMYFKPEWSFPKVLQKSGFSIAHWHGYVHPEAVPNGWNVYGMSNPSVSCSSPQAAIYAFLGKQIGISKDILNNTEYNGDIHIEPHHGTNMTFPTLIQTAEFLLSNKNISKLGSEYLDLYYVSSKLL
ncbi:MAG: hypothetical protein Q8Q48_02730 [Candidatus Staskawiczbacteria bacterium]|nr:hypothetical protein [Candidatus Staskawiczbacteria bacterium]